MAAPRKPSPFNAWETVRCELLNTRVCDLGLTIEGSPVEPFVRRLHREFAAKGIAFRPAFYLTDTWGCPDRVPVIGVPFYLADKRLARIEQEQTGELEDDQMAMMLVRHEAGHAVNYAYRLWEDAEWAEVFGQFSRPYREAFQPEPFSRQFVRHIFSRPYGRTYAQKHPDEDFAETFAVWLTPRSAWRRRYRAWPALAKLKHVDALMGRIRRREPVRTGGKLFHPIGQMDMVLAEHYGQRAEQFRAAAQGYVDDRLRAVFPPLRGNSTLPARQLLRKHHDDLLERMVRWSPLDEQEATTILQKLEDRAQALRLRFRARQRGRKLMDVAAMVAALAMEFAYTGRLMG
ncbi:MAG TPA: putative zinc-binding metallopeptidase [Planctomycetota bacterium]|nr:putative zinc-binding metallopeptidase [Planctomycetota bacterium]